LSFDGVSTVPAEHPIIAIAGINGVPTAVTKDHIIAAEPFDGVSAAASTDDIIAFSSSQHITVCSANNGAAPGRIKDLGWISSSGWCKRPSPNQDDRRNTARDHRQP
jgi:hypothetical protein